MTEQRKQLSEGHPAPRAARRQSQRIELNDLRVENKELKEKNTGLELDLAVVRGLLSSASRMAGGELEHLIRERVVVRHKVQEYAKVVNEYYQESLQRVEELEANRPQAYPFEFALLTWVMDEINADFERSRETVIVPVGDSSYDMGRDVVATVDLARLAGIKATQSVLLIILTAFDEPTVFCFLIVRELRRMDEDLSSVRLGFLTQLLLRCYPWVKEHITGGNGILAETLVDALLTALEYEQSGLGRADYAASIKPSERTLGGYKVYLDNIRHQAKKAPERVTRAFE